MKFTFGLHGIASRAAAALLFAITLANCSGASIPATSQPQHSSPSVAAHSYSALPKGAHIDSHGAPIDAYGRYLIYLGGKDPWRSVDRGVAIDPSLREAPRSALRAAALSAGSLPKAQDATSPISQDNCPWASLAYAQPSLMLACNAIGTDDVGALRSVPGTPQGTLRPQLDGFYYDDAHDEWAYDMKTQRWIKTIVSVVSRPSQSEYYPYFVAYDFINSKAMKQLCWTFGLPLPEGLVPIQSLAERFGLRGALEVSEKLIGNVFENIAASVGRNNMLRMTDAEANTIMATRDYTKPPFLSGKQAAQFTVNESMLTGKIAGNQLVRVGGAVINETSGWMTTMDQITKSDGTLMTAKEIFDKLALREVPTHYAIVNKVAPESSFLVGIANDMSVYGWGSGGGVQYFLLSGSYKLTEPIALPYLK